MCIMRKIWATNLGIIFTHGETSRMKNKFVLVLVALCIAFTTMIVVACPAEVVVPGPETGTYYYGSENEESLLSLYDGNKFTLVNEKGTEYGTYVIESGTISFTKANEKEPSGTATYNEANKTVTITDGGVSKLYLFKKYFDVTFNVYEGKTEVQKVLNGKTAIKPADPTREGYDFYGWYADDKFVTPYLFEGRTITGDGVNVYAKWELKSSQTEYVIDFDLGYEGAAIAPVTTRNAKLIDMPADPTREGYEFKGWWISDYETREKLTVEFDAKKEFDANTTLFAVWNKAGENALTAGVNNEGVHWTASTEVVTVSVKGPQGFTSIEQQVSGKAYTVNFGSAPAGDYEISITSGNKTVSVYYKNKALTRVSRFRADGSMLFFNKVANATDYYLTIECGDERHSHTMLHNGNSNVYNFANCKMIDGGIKFVVTASAEGYASSVSEVFVCERKLDKVSGFNYDAATGYLSWDEVENARGYVIGIGGKEVKATANRYSLKSFGIGEINMEVYAVAKGYASSSAVSYKVNKTVLASPTNVKILGTQLSWNGVEGAAGYTVRINGREYDESTTMFDFAQISLTEGDECSVSVRANAAQAANNSVWSDELDARYLQLAASLKYGENKLSWNSVIGAQMYEVRVNGETQAKVTDSHIKLVLNKSGINTVSVRYFDNRGWSEFVSMDVTAYMVMLDSRIGDVSVIYAAVGDKLELPDPEKPGYEFAGWYNVYGGAARNGAKYEDIVFSDNCDITLYADWTAKKYEVTLFDANDNEVGTANITYGEDYRIEPIESQNAGEIFAGWYTGKNGAGVQLTDNEGNSVNPWLLTDTYEAYAYFATDVLSFTLREDGTYSVQKGAYFNKFAVVTVPETYNGAKVSVVSASAFAYATGIKIINIPDTIEIIEVGTAFTGASKLEEINIYETGNAVSPRYSSHEGVLYSQDVVGLELAVFPRGKSGEYVVLDGTRLIGSRAFYNANKVTSVTIPGSVVSIMPSAFMGCRNIETLTILDSDNPNEENGLKISDRAFYSLTNLTTVNLPARISSFSPAIFSSTTRLSTINIAKGGSMYASKNGMVTNAAGDTLIYCPSGRTGYVRIPAGIATIAAGSFMQHYSITEVYVSYSVATIENNAFELCNSLQTLTFEGSPSAVGMTIGKQAFMRCYALKNVIFEKESAVTEIGEEAFSGCNALGDLTLPTTLTKIGSLAFKNCLSIRKIVIAEGNKNIDVAMDAFEGCVRLLKITIPSTMETLPIEAIAACPGVRSIDIAANNPYFSSDGLIIYNANKTELFFYSKTITPENGEYTPIDSVVKIRGGAFRNNDKIKVLNIGKNIEEIGDYAFAGMSMLTTVNFEDSTSALTFGKGVLQGTGSLGNIVLPSRIREISEEMFRNSAITGVTIGSNVTVIGKNAFAGCTGLVEIIFAEGCNIETIPESVFENVAVGTITIPKSVKVIESRAFAKVSASEIIFEEGSVLTTIGDGAFTGSGLVSISLPSSVTTLGKGVFEGAKKLTSVSLDGTALVNIPERTFTDCRKLKSFNVPNTINDIGHRAFYCCYSLASVTYEAGGEGALTIGDGAFHLCSKLTTLALPSRTESIGESAYYATAATEATFTDSEMGGTDATSGLKHIGSNAFEQSSLKTIELPEGLLTIGSYAFSKSESLTSAVIPSTVTNLEKSGNGAQILGLGRYAFHSTTLTDITFRPMSGEKPEGYLGVTFYDTFSKCKKLTNIVLPANMVTALDARNKVIPAISADAMDGCPLSQIAVNEGGNYVAENNILYLTENGVKKEIIVAAKSVSGEVVIPYTVSDIWRGAFASCQLITSIKFEATPEGQAAVPLKISAYPDTSSLSTFKATKFTSIELPSRTVGIGPYAFAYSGLTSIKIPGAVGDDGNEFGISRYAFEYCADLAVVEFEEGAENRVLTVDGCAFRETAITSLTLPSGTVSIGNNAFYDCQKLVTVNIPNSIKEIAGYAFEGCTLLNSVNFAEGTHLKMLDSSIFAGCTSLIEFKLPKSDTASSLFGSSSAVKKFTLSKDALLSDGVLVGLTSCEEFVVEEGNTSFVAEGGVLYNKNKSTLIRYPQSKADTSFAVPEGVTQIGDSSKQSAFYGAKKLTSVSIPASVRTIGAAAFYNCNALTNIDFLVAKDGSNFDLSIGEDAFGYSGLTSIVIPARVAAIGGLSRGTFRNNTSLTSVTFEKGSKIAVIPAELFNYCTALKSIHLPATVTEIGLNAFIYCESLVAVTIEEGGVILKIGNTAFKGTKLSVTNINALIKNVTEISEYAYQGTTSTVDEDGTLVIPEGVTTIGREAFRNANGIKKIQFPSSLVSIETYAFKECSNLTEVVIPDGVTIIESAAFANCASLKKVVVPSSVVGLGTDAFADCAALEEADVACDIGVRMFRDCVKLTNLTLGNTVTTIGLGAFSGCNSLERVVLPSSITNVGEVPAIGREVFKECKKLESVIFAENYNPITIGEWAFNGCINLSKVVFPSNLVNMDAVNGVNCAIGAYSFAGCTSLTELIGLEILEGIGDYAFHNTGLTSIYIPATLSVFGTAPFLGCKLQSVELMDGNNTLMQKDGAIYDVAMTTLMLFPLGYDGDVTIPESVIALNDGVFAGSMIRSVTLPSGIREVSANAFDGCVNLKKVNCEGGLASIGKFAFRGCTSLESIEFSTALDTISSSAFQGSGLKSVTIGVNVTLIADRAFKDCVNLESVNFDKRGVKTLRMIDYAFEGCISLTNVEFPWRLRDVVEVRQYRIPRPPFIQIKAEWCDPCIGIGAFGGCTKLETVTIEDEYGDGLSKSFTYADKAFMGCTSLKSIEISKYVKYSSIPFIAILNGIGESLFEGCVALKEVIFPDGCENTFYIGKNAFKGCAALQSINLPATCTQLDVSAFDGCIAIKTLNVPVAVTKIGQNAFNGWTAAQTIIMKGKAAAPTGYASTWDTGCNANIVWETAQ